MISSALPPIKELIKNTDSITWRIDIAPSLPYFKGHFPSQAVLPGVTQLDWAVRLGCQHFGLSPSVRAIEALKFQQAVPPGLQLNLQVRIDPKKNKLTFAFTDDDKCYSSGRIVLNNTVSNNRTLENNTLATPLERTN